MINLKKLRTSIEIALLDKIRIRIDHMIHAVKIDNLTGHAEKDNFHFILKIIFHCKLLENHALSQNLYN